MILSEFPLCFSAEAEVVHCLRYAKWIFTFPVMDWPDHNLCSLEMMLPWMDRIKYVGCYFQLSGFTSSVLREFLTAHYANSQTWVRHLQEALKMFWRTLDKVALMASKPSIFVHVQVNWFNSIALVVFAAVYCFLSGINGAGCIEGGCHWSLVALLATSSFYPANCRSSSEKISGWSMVYFIYFRAGLSFQELRGVAHTGV